MKHVFIVYLLKVFFGSFAQEGKLSGKILDASLKNPLYGAHILNIRSGYLCVSRPDGSFSVPVLQGDTILITHVGFNEKNLIVSEKILEEESLFLLHRSTTILDEVRVIGFPNYQDFKEIILKTEPIDSSIQIFGLDQVDYSQVFFPQLPSTKDPESEISIGGGFRFDLGPLTRKGREMNKLEKILEEKNKEEIAFKKFNKKWVRDQTSLRGEELIEFIIFCEFSNQYLMDTPLYMIREKMMTLLDEFKSRRRSKENYDYAPGS
ncbi:MAG: hypothetical protein AAF600_17180 [Bacteroidota bacterium]